MKKTSFPKQFTRWPHLVSYGEVDAMKFAYYGHYLHWFEQARTLFIRRRGMSYNRIEEKGIFLPVREAHIRYRRPAKYDQLLYVLTGIESVSRASLTFIYHVVDSANEDLLLAEGTTQHACVNSQGKPVALPDWLKDMIG